MTDILYIIGSGRSGSTLVERVLNTASNTVAVGEIHALWRLDMKELLCSCGKRIPDCAFWTDALSIADIDDTTLRRLSELEHRVVRNKFLSKQRYDLKRIAAHTEVQEFNAIQARLFDGIKQVSGAQIVVDSSKAGPRAWILASQHEVTFLHLYRAAKDVMASWQTPKYEPASKSLMKKPPIRDSATDWIKVEQSARWLAKESSVQRMRYAEFASDPKKVLSQTLGQSLPSVIDSVNWIDDRSVRPDAKYHSVLGNPDRYDTGSIEIRPRSVDLKTLGWRERMYIQTLGAFMEFVYP